MSHHEENEPHETPGDERSIETAALAVHTVGTIQTASLFRSDDPAEIVKRATAHANALAGVIDARNLFKIIKGRKHVLVEGWTLLGSMLGVFPVCVWSRKLEDGWEARVEARTRSGEVVGAAEAQCVRSESTWANRDDFALRSMAQTRATSKALRLPLGFVMILAGYEATPMEEMPGDQVEPQQPTTKPGGKVSRKQIAELIDLVSRKGTNKDKFLQWATGKEEGGRYEDITTEVYEKAVTQLKNRPDKTPAEAKT